MSAQKNTTSTWPRAELEQAQAIIKKQDPTVPGAAVALYQTLFLFNDKETAQALLDFGTAPDERTMRQGVFNLDAKLMEKMIRNGGEPTAQMLHDAVRTHNPTVAEVLVKYGAVPTTGTERLVKMMKRFSDAGEKVSAALDNTAKVRRTARVRNFVRKVKSQLEV